MFKDGDIMLIFLRNRVLRLRQKYPLANFHIELFSCLRVSIPGGYPRQSIQLFQALRHRQFLHIAFARDVNTDSGTFEVVTHKHYDYASTALTLAYVTNTTRLLGGKIERDALE